MKAFSILIQAYFTGQACEPKETSMRPCGTIKEAFWDFPLVWDKKRWSHPILEFLHWDKFKIDWDFDLAHSKPMAQSIMKVESEYPHGIKTMASERGVAAR